MKEKKKFRIKIIVKEIKYIYRNTPEYIIVQITQYYISSITFFLFVSSIIKKLNLNREINHINVNVVQKVKGHTK